MKFRHLDYPEDTFIDDLGDAALDDLLERGDLLDWQPVAKAIAAEPFGDVAQRVLRLCDANPRYGTSPLWRAWIGRRQVMAQAVPVPRFSLAELRRRRGLSQTELAARIGMAQSDLSKAERRADWKVSTLSAILAGLGLRPKLIVEDEAGHVVAAVAGVPPNQDQSTGG